MRAVCERASRNCRVVLSSFHSDAERTGPCDVDGIRDDVRARPASRMCNMHSREAVIAARVQNEEVCE